MKIQLEFLNKVIREGKEDYIIDNSKTIIFPTKQKAKERLDQLKLTLPANKKVRVIEYRNDEPDETRSPCKILYE